MLKKFSFKTLFAVLRNLKRKPWYICSLRMPICEHQELKNFKHRHISYSAIEEKSFIIIVDEIYSILLSGYSIVLFEDEEIYSLAKKIKYIHNLNKVLIVHLKGGRLRIIYSILNEVYVHSRNY